MSVTIAVLTLLEEISSLSIDFKVTSLTEWAAQLKMNPLHAILSGFEPGNTPGVGTFYDFINRLWNSDDDHMSPHIHPLKTKVKKPKTKGTKADSVEKVTVANLLPVLENTDFELDEQPYSSLFAIYQKEFLDVSVSTGLIHSDALALAGNGMPVVTSHRERKKRICTCLLIPKVTYRYFLIFAVLQNMIHMDSCTLFSR